MNSILTRRRILLATAASAVLPAWAQPAAKPIKWVVPYPAGGGSDFLARTVGAQMAMQLKQPVVIENRPGAATMIGAEAVAKSPADGLSWLSADNGTLVFNSALYKKLPYDPERDFAPVGLMARFPLILVAHPASGFKSAREVFAAARQSPGKLSYASPGAGSPHHLAMELLKQQTGSFIVHIPYRGAAPAVQDVLGNQVPLMVVDTAVGMPHIKAGRLVALGVATRERLPALPQVPTLAEQGIADAEVYAWQGLVLPAATPKEIQTRIGAELQKAIATPEIAKKLADFGLEPIGASGEQLASFTRAERLRWHALIKARGLALD